MLDWLKQRFLRRRFIEQHLAVFGESGSGKTTLVSAFYGWHNEPEVLKSRDYVLTATDPKTGQELHSQYLRLAQDQLPTPTRFRHHAFEFQLSIRSIKSKAGTIVWHDYPGEWWTEQKSGEEEQRRQNTFRALLKSDVALFLCDGARFKKDGSKYIKSLIRSFRDALQLQAASLLENEAGPLSPFPRVWIICLSKADLFPDKDVFWFRDEVVRSSCDELEALRETIKGLVGGDTYLTIGNDFLLLSSAEIDAETGKVKDAKRQKGLDLIPAIAVVGPIRWAKRWAKSLVAGKTTVYRVTRIFKGLTTNWLKYVPIVGNLFMAIDDTLASTIDSLRDVEKRARERGDAIESVIAGLEVKLRDDSNQAIYLSPKP